SARQIIDLLLAECAAAHVDVRSGCKVRDIRKQTEFGVETNLGAFASDSLVIATGGLSFAKLGATDFGYRVARQFGLDVTELRPALVPLKFAPGELADFHDLSGVSLDVIARHRGQQFREN